MNISRFARSIGFGVALAIAIPVVADAMPQRVYDPTTHSFVDLSSRTSPIGTGRSTRNTRRRS